MDHICLVVPIMAGKTKDARDFMRELEEQRKPVYDRSERRIGITKELRHLAHTPAALMHRPAARNAHTARTQAGHPVHDPVPLEYSIEWLTCAIASRLGVVMVGWPVCYSRSSTCWFARYSAWLS